MEKYTKAQMEVIEFENEDVITTSGTCNGADVSVNPWAVSYTHLDVYKRQGLHAHARSVTIRYEK